MLLSILRVLTYILGIAGSALLLHDAFWDADNEIGMQYAKEIVEYRTNTKIDSVVAINSQALDAILAAAGPLEINGKITNASGIDIIREDDGSGVSRGDAVMAVVKAVAKAASDNPNVKSAMIQAALDQYSKGNIVMDNSPINITTSGKNIAYITNSSSEDITSPITVEPAISIIRLITGARMAMKV